MSETLQGIHHITAVAGDPVHNLRFYRDVLGLRLVKKTVNFDDRSTYHFYFGDEVGSPGTILTFFPWPRARQGRPGVGTIETVAFSVPRGSLAFWRARLAAAGVETVRRAEAFDENGLRFADPDGMPLELIESDPVDGVRAWTPPDVPAAQAIMAFHSATQRVRASEPTDEFIRKQLGFVLVGEDGARRRYRTSAAGVGVYDVVTDPTGPEAVAGRGTVHHIAWVTKSVEQSLAWRTLLTTAGNHVSPLMDRKYFRSIYFREPAGVLFEMATNGPGFAVDEPLESLGSSLRLPENYEGHRAEIEAVLPKLDA
jgi:glyoxalase family protein